MRVAEKGESLWQGCGTEHVTPRAAIDLLASPRILAASRSMGNPRFVPVSETQSDVRFNHLNVTRVRNWAYFRLKRPPLAGTPYRFPRFAFLRYPTTCTSERYDHDRVVNAVGLDVLETIWPNIQVRLMDSMYARRSVDLLKFPDPLCRKVYLSSVACNRNKRRRECPKTTSIRWTLPLEEGSGCCTVCRIVHVFSRPWSITTTPSFAAPNLIH